ncbi:MAG: 5-(carboxyamino)imidazole ribonucleotide synthase [Planctomycetota bacterium]
MKQTVEKQAIAPGATIGMVGGGQLGRMFAIAAAQMGYRVSVFCGSSDEPAAQVANTTVCGPLEDHSAIEAFAKTCDVITLEFENIPAETIAACSRHAPTYPSADVLAVAQDRFVEKSTLQDAGLPVTPFRRVSDAATAIAAGENLGWPMIIKTCRSGYDGKGQHRIESPEQAEQIDWQTNAPETSPQSSFGGWIAESLIPFDLEISVVVARTVDGRTSTFPVFENDHQNHILDLTRIPSTLPQEVQHHAMQIATAAAESLDVVGLLCVEFFVSGDDLRINEVAPRPHNSGHVSIEACATSQFQQHVRAICGLPLGDSSMTVPAAAMANLMGDLWPSASESPNWPRFLDSPGVQLHLYGKHAALPGRKMGHATAVGPTIDDVVSRLNQARDVLRASSERICQVAER